MLVLLLLDDIVMSGNKFPYYDNELIVAFTAGNG